MQIFIEQKEEEEGNKCFDDCFDDELLDLGKNKTETKFGANKEEQIYDGISSWKTKFLSSNYQVPPMTCSQLIVNWLLGSVSENVPPFWNFCSKEVKHINNCMRMWNIIK